ncbi:MAG: EVE domain-containing protein [Candidatus Eisenbacteria bacterium]|nr:EVE domain-containing protein [Candidatus Eisenbacteria bacterium]MCC7144529.1 EVE domain-containing protein [Candidatus Eisenbacteria bacterium]
MAKRYWLFKSEPSEFSFEDLARAREQTTFWDGVRNYQARNLLRDEIQVGDGVLYYHSSTEPTAVIGTAEVVRAGYPDHTQFDPKSSHFDPGAKPEEPRWYMVDIRLVRSFAQPVPLATLKQTPGLAGMTLLQRGSRLSVQPVSAAEWEIVCRLGG